MNLAAIVFAMASVACAIFILPHSMFCGYRNRIAVAWLLGMPLISFVSNPGLLFLILFTCLFAVAPVKTDRRLFLFMALVPALPLYIQMEVPFPGINYLFALNYYKMVVIAFLLPLFFIPAASDTPGQRWSVIDFCIVSYLLYSMTQIGMYYGLTSALRFILDQILIIGIPYFALTRFATRPEIVEKCLKGFVVAAVILGVIAVTVTIKQWDFYRISHFDPIAAAVELRGGLLRVQATLTTHSLGFHLAIAVVCLEYLKTRMRIGFLWLWAMRTVLLSGMYFTGSRGAMVGLIVALAIYVVLSIRNSALRWTLIVVGGVFASIASYILMFGNAAEYDTYGSFTYRQWLLDASLEYLAMHPLFGDVGYIDSGHFDHLVQGQGIIDITNMYLQVALNYGLIGIFLFFLPFLITIIRLMLHALSKRKEEGGEMYALFCGSLVGWLALIATTSDVGLTLHLGLMLLAFGHALVQRTAHMPQRSASPANPWTPTGHLEKARTS